MYNEIFKHLKQQLSPEIIKQFEQKTIHLGIFSEPYLTYMLNGKKTMEARLTKNKIPPYEHVTKDDIVIVKKSAGDILAYFTIKDVEFINIKDFPLEELKNKYNDKLCFTDLFWKLKRHSNYATLITIDKINPLQPFSIGKTGRMGWIKLKKSE